MRPRRIYVAAAEASGDRLGADLIKAIKHRRPDIRFYGVGGHLMHAEGIESPFNIAELSVLGLVEGLKAYPLVVKRVAETLNHIQAFDPDVVVLIDSWGFMVRIAQALRRAGSRARIVKYIGPQVWASRPGRARTLARTVDHLLCIYEIETPFYEPYGLPCTVVGNPVANAPVRAGDGASFRAECGISADARLLLILFGSRPSEIQRLSADFIDTAKRLLAQDPKLKIVTFVAATVRTHLEPLLKELPAVLIVTDDARKEEVFAAPTVALACSGSVTTELALQGVPMVVAYRLGAITWFLVKNFLFKAKFATLLNIAADKAIVQEFLQNDCNPENLSAAISRLLNDPAARSRQIQAQNAALEIMGKGKASAADIAADAILDQPITD